MENDWDDPANPVTDEELAELHTAMLRQEREERIWGPPPVPITEDDIRIYTHGRCGDLAVALYEQGGLDIYGERWVQNEMLPSHVFVRRGDLKLDVMGLSPLPEDARKLYDGSPEGVRMYFAHYTTDAHTYGIARTLLEGLPDDRGYSSLTRWQRFLIWWGQGVGR